MKQIEPTQIFVLGLKKNDYLISEEHSCFQIHVGLFANQCSRRDNTNVLVLQDLKSISMLSS